MRNQDRLFKDIDKLLYGYVMRNSAFGIRCGINLEIHDIRRDIARLIADFIDKDYVKKNNKLKENR